jgi:hypothetical protein
MAREKMTYRITEVTVATGRTATIEVEIGDRKVRVPVPAEVKAYFNEQFVRRNPTPTQSKRFATLMNLLRAAYQKGKEDGGKAHGG